MIVHESPRFSPGNLAIPGADCGGNSGNDCAGARGSIDLENRKIRGGSCESAESRYILIKAARAWLGADDRAGT